MQIHPLALLQPQPLPTKPTTAWHYCKRLITSEVWVRFLGLRRPVNLFVIIKKTNCTKCPVYVPYICPLIVIQLKDKTSLNCTKDVLFNEGQNVL